MRLPDHVYVSLARGEISHEDVERLETYSDNLEKVSAFGMSPEITQDIIRTAVNAGVITAAAGGLALAGKGLGAAHSAITYKSDLKRILAVHPDLKEYTPKEIDLAYTSIRTLNPEFAKDPLVGGQLLGQILRNRSPDNPRGAPRVDLGTAKDLVDARSKRRPGAAQELMGTAGLEAAKASIGERARQRGVELSETRADRREGIAANANHARGQAAAAHLIANPGTTGVTAGSMAAYLAELREQQAMHDVDRTFHPAGGRPQRP